MRSIITILFILICSSCFAYEVTVYGVNNCGITTALRNELTAKQITFTYCDVNGGKCMTDMVKVATDNNLAIDGVIYFPIVRVTVDGKTTGLCRPAITDILKLIGTTNVLSIGNGVIHSSSKGIDVYNLMGVKVFHSESWEIDISSLPKGIYVVNGQKIVR